MADVHVAGAPPRSGSAVARNVPSFVRGMNPRWASSAYSTAEQWPFDRMKRSRSGSAGSVGFSFSSLKNSAVR